MKRNLICLWIVAVLAISSLAGCGPKKISIAPAGSTVLRTKFRSFCPGEPEMASRVEIRSRVWRLPNIAGTPWQYSYEFSPDGKPAKVTIGYVIGGGVIAFLTSRESSNALIDIPENGRSLTFPQMDGPAIVKAKIVFVTKGNTFCQEGLFYTYMPSR